MNGGRKMFPSNGSVLFDGGKNSKFEKSIIEDNESPDCANVIFSNGSVETREGCSKINTAAITAQVSDGLYTRRASDGSETMCAFTGGSMYTLVGTSFITVPSAQSIFTVGARVASDQYLNYMFIGNGGAIPYKWDGSNFTRHGVYPPTSTISVASNGAGLLGPNLDYQYKTTFVNSSLVESDVGPVTSTFTISNASGQNILNGIPTAPQSYGVSERIVYRTAGGGSTFKRLVTLSDNTTTTYSDNIPDSSLGVTAPTDNGVPPLYSAIVYHQGRVFMNDPFNPNFVWYSELGQPYTVQRAANFFTVGDKSSDLVKAFGVYDNALVVFCEKSITVVYMQDTSPDNWKFIKTNSPYGTKSLFAISSYLNKLIFAALQNNKFVGFASLSGNTVDPTATILPVSTAGSDLKSDRIEPDMFSVQESYLGNISSIVYKNKAYITLTYGSGSTLNNRIYLMDFSMSNLRKHQKESWVPWTGLNAAQFTIYNGGLYYSSSTANGFVYKLETGNYNDDGVAIDSYYWTKEYSGTDDEYNFFKDFRYANLLVDLSGSYYMSILYRVDSDKGSGTSVLINLDPGSNLWGVMNWGDMWGGGSNQKEFRIYLGSSRGKRIQYQFSNQNTVNQRFKVHRMNFLYNVKGYR